MRRLLFAAAIAVATAALAGPAAAHDTGYSHRHDRQHDRLERQHDRADDRLEHLHDRAHYDYDMTRREHRRLHRYLERQHDRTHDRLEDRHDRQHDRDDRRWRRW